MTAALATLAVLGWETLTVHFNYGGDWTALYDTGAWVRLPPELAGEDVYRFPNSAGYDGQFYHLIAHDPFLRRGWARFADNPGLRWRRILVPALANAAVFGDDERVDSAYFAVLLGFVALGVYWTSRYFARIGWRPAWGAVFLAIPATMTSIDRATVDVALVALCAGFALYAFEEREGPLWMVLALAPLARETGLALIAGYCLWLFVERRFSRMAWFSCAALPAIGWFAFVRGRTGPDQTPWTSVVPLAGLVRRTLHPVQFELTTGWLLEAAVLDYLGVIGVWFALGVTVWWLVHYRPLTPLVAVGAVLAAGAMFLQSPDIWAQDYSFARTQSPLLMCLALEGAATARWEALPPLVLCLLRVVFQLAPQGKGILRGVF
jgi:hypothetical protein